ncbi:MAG: c-type cytochrome [Pirellulaceae bacterium]
MNKNKHLLLWSSLGVLLLLIYAAVEENFLKQWRKIQASARTETGPLDVRLRQVVVPALHTVDRCVSCHVGMAPGEQSITGPQVVGAHPDVVHDPAEYGCTVCHGGQGRATDKADAHGDVHFWPQPMIPSEFAYAGCGSCHTHIRVPNPIHLQRGLALVERYDCLACHRLDGRGATLRPAGAGGMEGPDLSRVGAAGYQLQWYQQHMEQFEAAHDGPWRTSFGPIETADRQTIDEFLATRVGAPELVEAKALFHSLGCRGCHKVSGVGGEDGPDLTRMGDRDPARLDYTHVPGAPTLVNWLAEHFRAPARVVPGSQMPAMGLSEEEIRLLVIYMLSLRRSDFPEAFWPADRLRVERLGEREFATDGATLFGTFCSACHGESGEGRWYPGMVPFPANGNPDFLAVATDEFIANTIRQGRPGRRMPAWGNSDSGLRPEEITAIVAHLRQSSGVVEPVSSPAERRWVQADAAAGGRTYARYCAGCHGARGEGVQAPALNNQGLLSNASDFYLIETIGLGRRGTPMPSFRSASPVHPALADDEIKSLVALLRKWEV